MLLASGVSCGVDTIVPIIIDRDLSNKDLSRTKLLIEDYIDVGKIAETNGENRFFKTKIKLLHGELCLHLKDNTQKFDEFIGKSEMTKENQALVEMLFSEKTLKMDMTAGFQGNPNIGSVVLNQFDNSDIFKSFAADFKAGDKIFIISSIFGGTGASGFPLLRKVLQTPNQTDGEGNVLPNWGLVNKAQIGAISVLPYFQVRTAGQDDESLVDSDTFTDKAKAALTYYKTEDKKLDTLYYIADKRTSTYEHNKGGDAQKNNAHFVELAAALSILDFVNPAKSSVNIHRDSADTIIQTTYKEFGIDADKSEINFADLEDETKNLIVNQLSRFLLFRNYMQSVFDTERPYQPYAHGIFGADFRSSNSIKKLESVQKAFYGWLQEMEAQNRKFSPFVLDAKNAFDFIRGNIKVVNRQNLFDRRYRGWAGWAAMDNELNRQSRNIAKTLEPEKRFLELFYRATAALLNFKS
jgi:hypothetical protein